MMEALAFARMTEDVLDGPKCFVDVQGSQLYLFIQQ